MRAAGVYVDDHRQVRCRTTGKLALSRRIAVARARAARRSRTDAPVSEYLCRWCDWWHIGHADRRPGRTPPRRPRSERRRGW